MEIRSERHAENVIAYIFGEVDHHNAKYARDQLDKIIEEEQPASFGLDLRGVSFCDSSGLGLVMGRMRKCLSIGCSIVILNPSPAAEKILEIAGMDKILKIERGIQNV